MPPNQKINPVKNKKTNKNVLLVYYEKYFTLKFLLSLILDPARLDIVKYLILAGELLLNIFIVNRINYTEIDWVAYMQECEGFLNGTTNYAELKGMIFSWKI
jgi:alpha-1,3-mannosyltransferase